MPQHVRVTTSGPVRQVRLGGHANGLEQAATSGAAISTRQVHNSSIAVGLDRRRAMLLLRDAVVLPAAARPADRRPAHSVRRDQRHAGHPGRQHRSYSPPLPVSARIPSGHSCGQLP
jgi:hypothetical protein